MSLTEIENHRWQAVIARRDDSSFLFGVRTTRVACRPGCPARTPIRENVRFFENFAQAQSAGYRACKRCAPQDSDAGAARRRWIERACATFARDPAVPIAEVAASLGLSRFHFQRLFRVTTGVTPAQYRRALRNERFKALLERGASVTEAMHEAGFGSPSRAYASAALGMPPSAYRKGAPGETLRYAFADSSLGRVLVASTPRGIAAIELGEDDAQTLAALRAHFPLARFERDDGALARALRDVVALVDDPRADVGLQLDIRGTAFQRRIWDALRQVPSGARITYRELAAAAGVPGAARAAGAACGANRHAVAIPCHRVVRADGELGGYRWGPARKRSLLEREERER